MTGSAAATSRPRLVDTANFLLATRDSRQRHVPALLAVRGLGKERALCVRHLHGQSIRLSRSNRISDLECERQATALVAADLHAVDPDRAGPFDRAEAEPRGPGPAPGVRNPHVPLVVAWASLPK
jgi:hypothetical protein